MTRRIPLLLLAGLALLVLFARGTPVRRPTVSLGAMGHGPTVVLVHGLGVSATHWLPVARDLARDHRVVLVEMPGHGIDEMPGGVRLEDLAAMLDRAIAAESDGPVLLVGHSVGGLVAVAEALRSPKRVRALVLVDTSLRPQLGEQDRADLMSALDHDYRGTLRATYESFGRDSAQGAALYDEAARLDSTALKTWIRLAVSTDLSHEAADLRAPMLAVFSERSWPDGEPWKTCADSLGYAAVRTVAPVRIVKTGHFIMLDRPQLLADMIRRFDRDQGPAMIAAGGTGGR